MAYSIIRIGGFAIVWFFGWLLLLAAAWPEYSHRTKAISELGAWGAPHMALWNLLGFAGTGALLIGFGWAYGRLVGPDAVGRNGLLATGVLFALTAIPIEIGADADPDYASGWTGAHLLAVLMVPVPWLYAVARIATRFGGGDLNQLARVSRWALIGFIVFGTISFARLVPDAPGLMQRISFIPFLGWYAAAAWVLARRVPIRSNGDSLAGRAAAGGGSALDTSQHTL